MDCRLRTTDCGLGIKYGLGIKCGLRTEYKTRTRYKTRTTDYVYENSFRKVKLREMESGLAKTVVPACFNIPLAVLIVYSSYGEGRLCRYSRQLKLNAEFYKKKELEEISNCSFKPIRSTELKKIVLVFVRSVKFLSDATILFHVLSSLITCSILMTTMFSKASIL